MVPFDAESGQPESAAWVVALPDCLYSVVEALPMFSRQLEGSALVVVGGLLGWPLVLVAPVLLGCLVSLAV